MRRTAIAAAWLAGALVMPLAHAQKTVIDCFAPTDCRLAVGDALTPKFSRALPSPQYKLVVFGSVHRYSDTQGAAYAVAGVAERTVVRGTDVTLLPLRRYSASVPIERPRIGEREEQDALRRAIRAAVGRMMEVCDQSPDCDVHKPYR